jgi:DNA-binding CsgD family transcriptional regulator
MAEPLTLLHLVADLHRAAPYREAWPRLVFDLGQWIGCPTVFGEAIARIRGEEDKQWWKNVEAGIQSMRRCACSDDSPCGDSAVARSSTQKLCLAVADQLDLAIATARLAGAVIPLATLDALPLPLLICDGDRHLVAANRSAAKEVDTGRWLCLSAKGTIEVPDRTQAGRFASACARLAAEGADDEAWLPGSPGDTQTADITLRRIADSDRCGNGTLILVSLVVHAAAPDAKLVERLGDRRRLPPRQRELAGHLLAGLSLDQAAMRMGITRRTARDHLTGLFRATGTSRQTELVARLSRESLG